MNTIERIKRRFSRNEEKFNKSRFIIKNKPQDNRNSVNSKKRASVDTSTIKSIIEQDPRLVWQKVIDIGDGAFSKVYKVKNKSNGVYAAAKIIEKCSRNDLDEYLVEIKILRECNHKNVVKLYEAYFYNSELWVRFEKKIKLFFISFRILSIRQIIRNLTFDRRNNF
jgi:serine/threonine protein kinase